MFEKIEINSETSLLIPSEVDFKKIFQEALIDPSEEIKQQPIAISIRESDYKGTLYPIPFGSYGDFSCIVGASKSRKTFFKSMIEAGYIGGSSNILNPSIKGHNSKDKFVISFDTEQSQYHTQRVQRRVLEMVGANYDLYKTFSLRQYNPKERFDFIDWVVFESDFKDNIGLMSIDGYVDLVTDFNNLEQATGLTEKLLQWTAKGKMHCTGILHKNFGTAKPVGHVGSSVLKKAETVVFVEKNENETIAKCEYSRNIPFEPITFDVNKDWLPYETDNNYSITDQTWLK
ncbi:MAG TPA: hypothetical protein PKH91_04235 [Flavobacterium sp.]|nr:hypothetical protein [Flavobacterium sp.]